MLHEKTRRSERLHPGAQVDAAVKAGLLVLAVCFGGLGTWAATAPLSGAVIAVGVVKVDSNRKTIQHLEGGIVEEILVRDGDQVAAGQPLVVLVDERVNATLEVLGGQRDAELAKAARLQAERDGRETIGFPRALLERQTDPKVSELLAGEQAFFTATRERVDTQIRLLREQRERILGEIGGLSEEVAAEEKAIALLGEEIAANRDLQAKHFVQKTQVMTFERMQEEYQARRGEHIADIARAQQKGKDLELRISTLQAERVQSAADELTITQARIFDLEERLRPSRDAQSRQRVVAPIAGTVVGLRVFTVGGVVRPGEPILDIVPNDSPLIVEAQIGVDDVDEVEMGKPADIRFTAFKSRSTPLVAGRVIYVSADRMVDEASRKPYFLMRVEIERDSLHDAHLPEVSAGMQAEVYVKTKARTALEYWLEPISVFLERSLRET
jgi:HlyD family type I secretion membrane fusion protein